jgi:nickel-dependent lactate racemase
MKAYRVPQLAWYGPRDLELPVPDSWQVQMNYAAGYNRPSLTSDQLRNAIRCPLGQKPLRELARGKKEVVIVFDDMTRATRSAEIVPFILEELSAAGVADRNIRFICGVGTHPPLPRQDLVKKLGEDVVARYRSFSHNAFGGCNYVGTTGTYQTKLYINEEYLKCDLKIVIGACVPHPNAGFGGGAKMIMPGIASFECILQNHVHMFPDPHVKVTKGMGLFDENLFRQDIEECAEMTGIDFLVNVIINLWGETVSIYAGDWRQAFAEALKEAKSHYLAERFPELDIVIANAYAKANESNIALGAGLRFLDRNTKTGSSIVFIGNAPEGQIPHYLLGLWGQMVPPRLVSPYPPNYPAGLKQALFYSEYPHPGSSFLGENEPVTYLSRWNEVLERLQKVHGDDARVGIIPDATNQYFLP